ncbi:MAG: glycoside hydrolase family 99-like domain-containing protein [Acidimicrobiales bacterium]|jgi:hypothetical protein
MEVLALYLPQYHPIAENDRWWGPGFTEWANVVRGRPLFRGHVQPHLPTELGFYDLRVPETREAQADLARGHGVTGFCYWHYWFGGHQLLQRPFDEVVASGSPDFPFCVAWANQSWSGTWHGAPNRMLMEQTYPGPEDDRAHFAYLRSAFEDPRYVKIDGRPVLFIYQAGNLPEPGRFVEEWQKMAHDAGLGGLYLVAFLGEHEYWSQVSDGFDAAVYFEFPFGRDVPTRAREHLRSRGLVHSPRRYPYADTPATPPAHVGGRVFPSIYPNWDNTPRMANDGLVATGATPERFALHARRAAELASAHPVGQQLMMIKSWNEWAEGNYLEPDDEYGRGRLQALAAALSAVSGARP